MSDLNSKLDRFAAAILAEATADTEHALAELAETRAAAYSSAEDQVLSEAYRYIRGEVERIKSETGRQASRHMLDSKRTLFLRRDQMAGEVFAAVHEKLSAYTASPAYAERMKSIYAEALAALGKIDRVRVFLRPSDKALAAALTAARPEVKAEFLDGDFTYGGLIADATDIGKRVDATFDSAMEELSGHFAELFGLSLADGPDEEVQA